MTGIFKRALQSCAAVGLVLAATGAVQADTWRYAFEEAMTDVQGVYAQKFKAEIEANSDHEIQLFPYGTLGESADIMEQTQDGILQFVDQSPGFTGALIPEAQVFFVPYLLPTDQKHLARFYRESKAINDMFKPLYAEKGLELLNMFPEGEVAMTTKKPVKTCADLNEVKFRVMTNPLLVESYRAFGASPTPLPWGEVYGGLQTNLIQGQENPTFFLYSTKIYEVTDYITYAGHNNFTTAVMANKDFFDGLSAEDKDLVEKAAAAAYDHTVVYQQQAAETELAKIMEAKPEMKVTVLTEDERGCFKAAAAEVEKTFIEMTGDSGAAIIAQMKADLAATAD
ncbi:MULTISPECIES: TRAP transporter substrate-binding protein DctP [unclassified Pseudovibrio]|uniref:TRAP transporter substrate-binding protein n=1 Tax=unclassified Pseudovibrio TaxID=2627060 RepID=UPI00070997A8|nr:MULTISPECIES: TRAP transporter substrate-binding protein DctP [unclassified Pseudovibrio]KZK91211.1 2,3-diketo-L-gulonate-binding periplasmic protein YiaO precursor [Pseudovibrio sp. Ad5]KZK98029.1 2,3-diketo-L-gulonate-binding periplasmic protein YiaO precursor [Pseudovibrio sp. W74]KZL05287.1 2,3-diketo-L-gulonate-binding periplasmic protein YiaO precursor [Pseudovibrio sp. Ad14]KZL06554.1 2,3-diketo-L-gulonate-binding periplasmic protein YiaO precursor [Pseudovibrio sp. Ad26]